MHARRVRSPVAIRVKHPHWLHSPMPRFPAPVPPAARWHGMTGRVGPPRTGSNPTSAMPSAAATRHWPGPPPSATSTARRNCCTYPSKTISAWRNTSIPSSAANTPSTASTTRATSPSPGSAVRKMALGNSMKSAVRETRRCRRRRVGISSDGCSRPIICRLDRQSLPNLKSPISYVLCPLNSRSLINPFQSIQP